MLLRRAPGFAGRALAIVAAAITVCVCVAVVVVVCVCVRGLHRSHAHNDVHAMCAAIVAHVVAPTALARGLP